MVRMASDENKNATEPPMSRPMKVVGIQKRICVWGTPNSFEAGTCRPSRETIVSTTKPNSETEAIAMATPLVMALVVLPTASRLTMTRSSASPVNSPDISATP